ncbi:unnamed protein product [Adineta steineri]|uniref:Lipoprotein n=1 Tax=Adineta steineri TaxID=433720 RepID=A0A818T3A7_9BILA|nr:unnamed protein product [Adineta steineri]CAF1164392.1 unnamed protein product [Adineta steineri]CAF3677216.1 unnamed protein product [Adineta steineri]CAF3837329.1 unnamed protein product [Adineta steineri]CAF4327810.1 unnamed protein product [Adineta steineri]
MIDRKILFGLSLVLLSTCYDLSKSYLNSQSTETKPTESSSSSYDSHSNDLYEQSSNIPPPKMKKQHNVPTIKFLFCHS